MYLWEAESSFQLQIFQIKQQNTPPEWHMKKSFLIPRLYRQHNIISPIFPKPLWIMVEK